MSPRKRHLDLVPEAEQPTGVWPARMALADTFEVLAKIARGGWHWTLEDTDGETEHRDPICAAFVVVFDAEGQPTAMSVGIDGENWTNDDRWFELRHDAHRAIDALRRMRVVINGAESPETPRYRGMREDWEIRTESRRLMAERKQADRERYEREHPWLCDCGQRCKTQQGMATHQRGRQHRLWAQRQEVRS